MEARALSLITPTCGPSTDHSRAIKRGGMDPLYLGLRALTAAVMFAYQCEELTAIFVTTAFGLRPMLRIVYVAPLPRVPLTRLHPAFSPFGVPVHLIASPAF